MAAFDPFQHTNPLVDELVRRESRLSQHRENASRQAQSFATLNTNGKGDIQLATVVPFDCTFIETPTVAHGFRIDGDTFYDGQALPRVTGGVWKWQRDRRGFYVGAYVFFTVDLPPQSPVVPPKTYPAVTHNFTFAGIAMKDLPDYLIGLA